MMIRNYASRQAILASCSVCALLALSSGAALAQNTVSSTTIVTGPAAQTINQNLIGAISGEIVRVNQASGDLTNTRSSARPLLMAP
jgi:hypothetical protein